MEVEYGTYEYENYKGMQEEHINFWYRQADCLLAFELSRMMCKEAKKRINNVN